MSAKGRNLSHHGAKVICGRLYAHINRRYFKGALPRCKFHILDNGALATSELRRHYDSNGVAVRRLSRAIICIHPKLAWCYKIIAREMLHEIVHVAWPKLSHGKEFERRMLRIRHACLTDQLF